MSSATVRPFKRHKVIDLTSPRFTQASSPERQSAVDPLNQRCPQDESLRSNPLLSPFPLANTSLKRARPTALPARVIASSFMSAPRPKATIHLWSDEHKKVAAAAAAHVLRRTPANEGFIIHSRDIYNILLDHPNYTQLCERIENLGLWVNRIQLGKAIVEAQSWPSPASMYPPSLGELPQLNGSHVNPGRKRPFPETPYRIMAPIAGRQSRGTCRGYSQNPMPANCPSSARPGVLQPRPQRYPLNQQPHGIGGPQVHLQTLEHPLEQQPSIYPAHLSDPFSKSISQLSTRHDPRETAQGPLGACDLPFLKPFKDQLDAVTQAVPSIEHDLDVIDKTRWDAIQPANPARGGESVKLPSLDDTSKALECSRLDTSCAARTAQKQSIRQKSAFRGSSILAPPGTATIPQPSCNDLLENKIDAPLQPDLSPEQSVDGNIIGFSTENLPAHLIAPSKRLSAASVRKKSQTRRKGTGRKSKPSDFEALPSPPPPQPQYQVYACEWQGCHAQLHNLQTLRRHIIKIHLTSGHFQCLWVGCQGISSTETSACSKEFRSKTECEDHIDRMHIKPLAWKLGDGPQGGIARLEEVNGQSKKPFAPLIKLPGLTHASKSRRSDPEAFMHCNIGDSIESDGANGGWESRRRSQP